ncbi:hypothetical protein B0H63DRAFT_474752 [Podospora didyma]|uniref:Gfo/Idh/MocA-like oxidoreductase N-terminal domain-containing protein n=1 Tax=Podospora didyma TaxID=330526 RepID=A0AAE0NGH6_9PEZI|nr:hypothetical protein B0H63DRAFT_474752 [Podospora didyma]
MAPIRVALIGLSATAKTSWASRAHLPYLLSPQGREKYQIVALLNSSVEAARAAIAEYNLPAETTKAYGDPDALAADADVDLVVCNTRVDNHHKTVRPSLEAGKAIFSEWPLAQDAAHARDLATLAHQKSAKTAVGLQGRLSPLAHTLRKILSSNRIGKVLSTEVRAFGGTMDRDRIPSGLAYFLERDVGGNPYTIGFAHAFDTVQSVLGDLDASSARGHFHLQRPKVTIFDPASGNVVETKKSNVPDLIFVSGYLEQGQGDIIAPQGAALHFRLRRGQQWPGEPGLVWTIAGERGEIKVTSPVAALQVGLEEQPAVIEVHDNATDTIEKVEWEWEDFQRELPLMSKNIAAVYEAFAAGTGGYATFDDAVKRHEQLESLLADWKA